jgi:uncharacterized LabA/DUF88 family protein
MIQDVVGPLATPVEKPEVALLIDGENISQDFADQIEEYSRLHGIIRIQRVFGNAAKLQKWSNSPGIKFVHSGTGKNATDLLLTVEAMEFFLRRGIRTIAVASSDRDFTHLAHFVGENGGTFIGIGQANASQSFRKSCRYFHDLRPIETICAPPGQAPENDNPAPKSEPRQLSEIDRQIHELIRKSGMEISILQLGTRMKETHNVLAKNSGCKNWRRYLEGSKDLYNCDRKGPNAKVRLKS